MKKYLNGVIGPNVDTSEIIYFDIEGSEVQFRLPTDPENPNGFIKQRDLPVLWKTAPQVLPLAKRKWKLNADYDGDESIVGTVTFEMRLHYLDVIDYEAWLGAEPYCLLKKSELRRLAIDHYISWTDCIEEGKDLTVSEKSALKEYLLQNTPEELTIAKEDLLPWMNLRLKNTSSLLSKCHTFIPLSERALIILRFEFTDQTFGKAFFFTETESLEFERTLRDEFLGHFQIRYNPATEEKIKDYLQNA